MTTWASTGHCTIWINESGTEKEPMCMVLPSCERVTKQNNNQNQKQTNKKQSLDAENLTIIVSYQRRERWGWSE